MVEIDNPILGRYGNWVKTTATEFAEKTEIYKALSQLFAKINHTHTKSDITDFSHTHTISNITNLQTTLDGKADANHTHNQWDNYVLNTYATLYVNETIHLCHLHYNRSFTSASADTFYTWHTALIPSEYQPSVQVQGSMNQIGSLIVNGNGDILGKFGIAWSSSRTVAGDCWWHY